MLSIIFLVSCVVIMYYKQVSEGFEDQARFGIMQKVGMTREEIRKSIDSQMLTVFAIPIIFACIHLAVVLPIVNKLLMLFGLFDMPRLMISAGVCAAFPAGTGSTSFTCRDHAGSDRFSDSPRSDVDGSQTV